MSESFVDLSYRGLALGKRIKLTQVRPQSGYLEMPTPMPVGTTIGIASDDGIALDAVVAEVHEQVGGSDRPPGMLVKPNLATDAHQAWWKARAENVPVVPKPELDKAPPPADAEGKVTVTSRRMSGQVAVPELMDDGRDTGVMDAVDMDGPLDTVVADVHDTNPSVPTISRDTNPSMPMLSRDTNPMMPVASRDSSPNLQDDGKHTVAMDAVDLAALGLTSPSGQMAAVKPEDYADDDAGNSGSMPAGDKPDANGGGKSKKKRKRR